MIENPTLPPGWSSEVAGNSHLLIIATVETLKLYITLDFDKRGYRNGYSTTGPMDSTTVYVGRGWKEQLISDAVQRLRSVLGERT